MIERATGPMSRRTAVLALGALALPWRAASADDQLVRLFAELGARRERHARFVERKFSALAKAPLESSGTLTFRAPNTLERHTIEPQRESVRIVGDTVTYEGTMRGSFQKRTFALADAPQLAALIESLRSTLAGDLAALRRHYDVALTTAQEPIARGWQITLSPRERLLRDAVSKVVLRGAGSELTHVEIIEAGGDLTLLAITAAPAAHAEKK